MEEDGKQMQLKLNACEKELISLKIQLEESRGHARQYKTIADTIEKAMQEGAEASESVKKVMEAKIAELSESSERLRDECEQAVEEKRRMEVHIIIIK